MHALPTPGGCAVICSRRSVRGRAIFRAVADSVEEKEAKKIERRCAALQ
jgi:hypothetical protein